MIRPTWDSLREFKPNATTHAVWSREIGLAPSPVDGPALRDAGLDRVSAAEDPTWAADAQRAIADLARDGFNFTAEDVRRIVGDPFRKNAMGAALNAAARRGVIQAVGYRTAKRGPRHASRMLVWVGVK